MSWIQKIELELKSNINEFENEIKISELQEEIELNKQNIIKKEKMKILSDNKELENKKKKQKKI